MMIHTTVNEHGICHNFAKREVMIPYQWSLLVVFMIIPVCVVSTFYGCIIKFLLDQTRSNILLTRDDLKVGINKRQPCSVTGASTMYAKLVARAADLVNVL